MKMYAMPMLSIMIMFNSMVIRCDSLSNDITEKKLPLWVVKSPAIRFIVLTMQSSGSHFLRSTLNSHPSILLHDEQCIDFTHEGQKYEFPDKVKTHSYNCYDQIDLSLGMQDASTEILDAFPSYWNGFELRMHAIKAIGILLHANQGWNEPAEIQQLKNLIYMKSTDKNDNGISHQVVKIVILHRKNYISRSFAGTNMKSAHNSDDLKKLHFTASKNISLTAIQAMADYAEAQYRTVIKELKDYIYVGYEMLVADSSSFLHVFRYLGVDDLSVTARDHNQLIGPKGVSIMIKHDEKHHAGLPYQYISNLQEVSSSLSRNDTVEHDSTLRYCMLYDNCIWFSSYCLDPSKCFLNP